MAQQRDDQEPEQQEWAQPPVGRSLPQIVWQRKGLVALGAVVGLALGVLVYTQRTPIYQSTAQVFVVKKNANPLPMTGVDNRQLFMDDYLANHIHVIKSPYVIEMAVKKHNLQQLKSFENIGDPTGVIHASLVAARDTTGGTNAPSNILNLAYRGPVADDCGTVLRAILESYQDFLDVSYRQVSYDTLKMIRKARDGIEIDLNKKRAAYGEFRKNSPLIILTDKGTTLQYEELIGIEMKRRDLQARKATLQARVKDLEEAIKKGRGREALAAQASAVEMKAQASIEQQLLPLLIQEQQLLEDYGEDHYKVVAVRRAIALTRDVMRRGMTLGEKGPNGEEAPVSDPVQRHLLSLRAELRDTEVMDQVQTKLRDDVKAEARALSSYELQERHLRDEIKQLEDLHKGTVKHLNELDLVRDAGGFDARALSRPGPGYKVAPSAFQILTAALLLGMLAGTGLAYLADVCDKSFRTPDEVRKRLGLPLVGHIPFLKPDPEAARRVEAGEVLPDPLLVTHYRSKSVEAEAYRAVRTALYFSTQGEGHKVIQVTSPNKGDGKSLLIANLAISIAQSGKRVILIDADCRRPRQHKVFGLRAEVGLAQVITGGATVTAAVQSTAVENLSLLPCGPIPHNPAELLTSPRFQELLESLRSEYDFVLVDTPPLLAVTDPCAVAPRVDGIFLTLRLSRQGRPHAERAREILAALGVNVLGVVVNGVTRQGGGGIYSAYYNYDYSENYEEPTDNDEDDAYYVEDTRSEHLAAAESPAAAPPPVEPPALEPPAKEGVKAPRLPRSGNGPRRGLLGWFLGWWV